MNVPNRKIIDDFATAILAGSYSGRLETATIVGEVPNFTGLLFRETTLGDTINISIPLGSGVAVGHTLAFDVAPYDVTKPVVFTNDDEETLYFSGGRSYTAYTFTAIPTAATVVPVPKALFASGVQIIRYSVGGDPLLGNRTYSVPQLVIIDGVSPYALQTSRPPAPRPPSPLPVPFDRNYFASQPDRKVMFTLDYDLPQGRQEGDYVQFGFGDLDEPIPIDASSPETKHPLPSDPAVVPSIPLSLDTIEAATNDNFRFYYRICDVANYCSEWSNKYLLTDVASGPAPTDLKAPLVDHAVPGDLLINRADVALESGLRVLIPDYTNPQRSTPTDTYRVTLTPAATPGFTGAPVQLADRPLGNTAFPVPVLATPAQLQTLYGNAVGNLSITVSYEVLRGTNSYPVAATTVFNLDLSLIVDAGTIDGQEGNPNFLPVIVNSVRGPGLLGPDNILQREDTGRPAVGRVPVWTAAKTPANALPFVVAFNYASYTPPPLTISTVADIPADGFFKFDIPWDIIRTFGGPEQYAYYTVRALGSTNQQSPLLETTVTVESVFKRMDRPIVRRATTTVLCSTMTPSNTGVLNIFIPPSPHLQSVTSLTLSIEGFRNSSQTLPSVATITPSFTVPISAATQGFDVTVNAPGAFFKQIQNNRSVTAASLRITYSVALPGEVVNSDPSNYALNSIRPGPITAPLYCDGTPVPAPAP